LDTNDKNMIDYVSREISGDVAELVSITGLETGCEVAKYFAGEQIYFRKDVARKLKYYAIIEDYKLLLKEKITFYAIIKRLSRKYNFSGTWIRKILKKEDLI